jgi:hypothetical protein
MMSVRLRSMSKRPASAASGVGNFSISAIASSLAPPCNGPRNVPMPEQIAE